MARYGFGKLAAKFYSGPFPLGTFIANLGACIVMGIALLFFASRTNVNESMKAMILVGFCGGFSTFSTFSHETLELIKTNQWGWVIGNITISIAACVGLLWMISKLSPN